MKRRNFLGLAAGFTVASASSAKAGSYNAVQGCVYDEIPEVLGSTVLFVPGYKPQTAQSEGMEARYHPVFSRNIHSDYDGPVRMLTRLDFNGNVLQALFPVYGHDVTISPDGKTGFFGSLEYDTYVVFDPETLDLISLGRPVEDGWNGGGHGFFLNGSEVLAISERAPRLGYSGKVSDHFGRITFREPGTMNILDGYSTHGVAPHDMRVLPDGKHMVIANYGTTVAPEESAYGIPRHIVEPSVTVLEISSGKLISKYTTGSTDKELRHICAPEIDSVFGIQAQMDSIDRDQYFHEEDTIAYGMDLTTKEGVSYFPASILKTVKGSSQMIELGSPEERLLMRGGLSIEYEPVHNEIIATYRSSHTVMVFDAISGETKQVIRTNQMGLDFPCGLAMLPGSKFYAVAGFWKNLYIFERGTHELVRDLCNYTMFFGHGHITAMQI